MTDVSVVILNYNYERFLATTIGSALNQTHPEVEVIVVDDGSTDGSRRIIDRFGDSIQSVFHETNRGQGAAINTGAAAADGDVIWFLDADDALLPEACATAAAAFEGDKRLAKFHTPLAVIDGEGYWHEETLPSEPGRLAIGDITAHVLRFRAHGWPPMSGNAYSADSLARVLPIPADAYRQAADSFLNEQIAICGPVARSDHPVAAYRRHGRNQFAGQPTSLQWLRTKLERELNSHERLGVLAEQLGLDGYRHHPDDVQDVAFAGYRMASLRLDPDNHPQVNRTEPDNRRTLAVRGIRAAWANGQLGVTDRLIRSIWFMAAAAVPKTAVGRLLSWYMPDGPTEPLWRRRRTRRTRRDRPGTVLVTSTLPDGDREAPNPDRRGCSHG